MRSFMLSLLKRVISNHVREATAEKRGGSFTATISLDDDSAEDRFAREPADQRDAETLFDVAWAQGVLDAAEKKLRDDFTKADNLEGYNQLREFLPLGDNATPYAAVAKKLHLAEGTLRLQIHRMRKRYGKLIEEEIAQTVSSPEEVKAELAHLMAVIGAGG
jgi:RNA polymerase sigma-70 factor (ECF subfamily)